MDKPLVIGGYDIPMASRSTVSLPIPQLYTNTPMEMPVHVIRGNKEGARLFVCAAIHGDELNGVEVIRRLLKQSVLKRIKGTLLAIPIVNVYGVIQHSRYLPDRRDLNRMFPGSERGSLAARLAYLFMNEIIENCTHGIDIHTGGLHRSNIPQVRADLEDTETQKLARAFGAPLMLNARLRDGSLRTAACEQQMPMLVYEAGEALRFDELSIRVGVRGVLNVMRALGMLPAKKSREKKFAESFLAYSSSWVRAPTSGALLEVKTLGASVQEGDILGVIANPYSASETEIVAHKGGLIIGKTHIPLVNEGDAIVHIARFEEDETNSGSDSPDLELDLNQIEEDALVVT